MDIFVPNKKLWIPDSHIADMNLSPIGQARMLQRNRMRCNLTPDLLMMMGAAGAAGDTPASYALNGSADYLTVPDHADWDWSGDITVEFWIRFASTSGTQNFIGTNAGTLFRIYWDGTSLLYTQSGTTDFTRSWSPSATTWYHYMWSRASGTNRIFIDGTILGSSSSDSTSLAPTSVLSIGRSATYGHYVNGNMDEIRLSDTARQTGNFTPPTVPYTSDANTLLLIHCSETKTGSTFTDSGNTGHTVTENGGAIEDTTIYKY